VSAHVAGDVREHPEGDAHFTPVCTTELGYMATIKPEFDKRGVKIIGLSVDSAGDHERWAADIAETQGTAPNYPLIADCDLYVAAACRAGRRPRRGPRGVARARAGRP
jgi:alkyl hydroperoxide reductase subunit AhpC